MPKVGKILVIGGGSSGWMAAALLSKTLPETQILLIEASDIPIIGVGESTNMLMRYFHRHLGIDEKAFMRASNAAFKVAIRFENFDRPGGVYHHPFGAPAKNDWNPSRFQPHAESHLAAYHVAEKRNVLTKDRSIASYQLDAGLYGQYLKTDCKRQQRVRHIVDRITNVVLTEGGDIARVQTESSGDLVADLYLDCSGFRSIVLDKVLHEPFENLNKYLLNDRAIAARVPYVDKSRELVTYTNCTALSAGWVWSIPLWSRIGTGYVYSSAFLSKSEAEAEYRAFLGAERVKDLVFNHIEIRTGRHARAWVGNCIGVGISYGFLEPLESTGLSLTQLSIFDLVAALSSNVPLPVEREMYNKRQGNLFDSTRDFIMAHYVLTTREDSPYWRHVRRENGLTDSLVERLLDARTNSYDKLERSPHVFYGSANWNTILSGMGFYGDDPDQKKLMELPETHVHAELLQREIYDGEYEEPQPLADVVGGAHPTWNATW